MEEILLPSHKFDLSKPKPVSASVKGGLVLMLTALVDMLVAFSTAYWATWSDGNNAALMGYVSGAEDSTAGGPQTVFYGGYGLWKMWRCELVSEEGEGPWRRHTDEELRKKMMSAGDVDSASWCSVRMADLQYPGWYVSVQVLETMGLAGLLTSLVMLLLFLFMPQCQRSKVLLSSLIALSYLAGLFIMVGLCVFGFKVAEEIEAHGRDEWFLSWSFSLACTAFVLNQIAASILITENKRL